ncbi:MAG: alpha/beta hydrolase [Steroidobacteraceae bacterium]
MPLVQQEFDDRVVLELRADAAPRSAPAAAPGATPRTAPGAAPSACVIWLHGLGADGYDFAPLVPELVLPADLAVRFVFPHAPVRPVTLNGGAHMRAWYDVAGLTAEAPEDAAGIRESASRIERDIRREREAGVPASRIVIAGFSQGGAIALHTALRHAEPLGGVLALSTYLPLQRALGGEASDANRRIPILMCHGRYDPVLAIEGAERSRELLRARGYAVEWKEYPMQHQVCVEEIADISQWLGRVLGDGATAARNPRS